MQRLFLLFLIGWVAVQGISGGWLGITIQDLTPQIAARLGIRGQEGVLITSVRFGSPARKGGLLQGDVIVSLDGKKIRNSEMLREEISKTAPGTVVEFTIVRGQMMRKIEISVGSPPREAA